MTDEAGAADEARGTEPAAPGTRAREGARGAARRASGGWRAARWLRRAVQLLTFAVFVYLLFAGLQRIEPLPHTGVFFRFDPLIALAAMLAARAWLSTLALALVTLALALLLGRVWCGWICPLGTLLGVLRFRSARRLARRMPAWLRGVKYVVLAAVVLLAALGNLSLLVLDPITLLTRTVTTSVMPGFVYLVNEAETAGMGWTSTAGAVTWIEDHFRGTVLPTVQPHYQQAIALLVLLVAIVLLNLLAHRFWCRYLCPLGALLGLVAKVQVLRPLVGNGCDGCAACSRACRVDAIEVAGRASVAAAVAGAPAGSLAAGSPATGTVAAGSPAAAGSTAAPPARVVSSECTMCLDCLVVCPRRHAMRFGVARRPGPWTTYDPGRREAIAAAAVAAGAAVRFAAGAARAAPHRRLVRPPGAQDEGRFLSRCARCGACMKACPSFGLQPALGEAGLEGLWTPVLKPRLGYCDYACAACGHVCPSGAIPKLSLAAKRRQVIGVAVIDEKRCLPWAKDTPCVVCQEMCPIPNKAIALRGQHLITRENGTQDYLSRPEVIAERCIGCGICEYKCPIDGPAAITVLAPGSARRRRRRGAEPKHPDRS